MAKPSPLQLAVAALSLALAIPLSMSAYGAANTQGITVQQAKSEIQKHRSKPTFEPPGPKVDAAKVKGEKLLVVAHDQVSDLLVHVAKGIQKAGSVAGLKVSLYNAHGQATKVQQGIQQGLNQNVGAILLDGVAVERVAGALKAANKANVPIISLVNAVPSQGGGGPRVDATAAVNNKLMGELSAYAAIVHSGGEDVNVVLETFNDPDSRATEAGYRAVFSQCPNCSIVASVNIEPSQWPIKVAPTTSAQVRAHPKVNFIMPTADTMGIFASTGVRQAGAEKRVKVISADGSGAGTLELVKKGKIFIADPGEPVDWIAWLGVDQALRLMTGMKPGNPAVPPRYLDSSDLQGVDIHDESAIYGDSYKAGFKKLWGISGN